MAETLKDLYGKLEKANIKLPDYDTFEKKYNTPEGADVLYKKLNSANIKLPDVESFKSKYFTTSTSDNLVKQDSDNIITKNLKNIVSNVTGYQFDQPEQKGIDFVFGKDKQNRSINTPSATITIDEESEPNYKLAALQTTGKVNLTPEDMDNPYVVERVRANKRNIDDQIQKVKDAYIETKDTDVLFSGIEDLKKIYQTKEGSFVKNQLDKDSKKIEEEIKLLENYKTENSGKGSELFPDEAEKIVGKKGILTKADVGNRLKELYAIRNTPKKELDDLLQVDESLNQVAKSLIKYKDDLAEAARETPEILVNQKEDNLLYNLAEYGTKVSNTNSKELYDANLLKFKKRIASDEQGNFIDLRQLLSNTTNNDYYTSNLVGDRAKFQEDTYNGIKALRDNIALAKDEKYGIPAQIKRLQQEKQQLIDTYAKANVPVPEQELRAFDDIIKYNENKLTNQNALSKKLDEIEKQYLSEYKDVKQYKEDNTKLSELYLKDSSKVGVLDQVSLEAKPFYKTLYGITGGVAQAIEQNITLPLEEKTGIISKEQRIAQSLDNYYAINNVNFLYVPDAIKNRQSIKITKDDKAPLGFKINDVNVRAALSEGVNTFIQSYAFGKAGQLFGKASGLSGAIGEELGTVWGGAFTSNVMMSEIDDQNIEKFLRGEIKFDDIVPKSTLEKTLEGATEAIWIPELKVLDHAGQEIVKKYALGKFLQESVGRKMLSDDFKYLAKTVVKNAIEVPLHESIEEIAGNAGQDVIDIAYKKSNLKYNPEENFTLLNNIQTALVTTISMWVTSAVGITSSALNRASIGDTYNYEIAKNADEFYNYAVAGINELDNKEFSKIYPQFASKQEAISTTKKVYDQYKQLFNEAAPTTSMLVSDVDKQNYFNILMDLKKMSLEPATEENTKKAAILLSKKLAYDVKASELRNKPIKERLSATLDESIDQLATDDINVPTLQATILQMEKWKTLLGDDKQYTKDVQRLDNKIAEVKQRIIDLTPVSDKPQEQVTPEPVEEIKSDNSFEKIKSEIDNLPKEEIKTLQSLSEIEARYPNLSESDQEKLYDYVDTKLNSLEKEADKVSTFKDKTGKEFSLTKKDQILVNGEVFNPISYENNRLKGKYLNNSQEISLNPEDFEISTDKEAINKVLSKTKKEETKETEDFISAETLLDKEPKATSSDIEAQKADIERRKQEELIIPNTNTSLYDSVKKLEKGIEDITNKIAELEKEGKGNIANQRTGVTSLSGLATDRKRLEDIREKELEKINKINAKYDAELAALEGKKEETKPVEEVEPVSNEELEKELLQINEQIKDALNDETSTITVEELAKLANRQKEIKAALGITESKPETKEEKVEKVQEKETKITDSKLSKVYYPFSTTPQYVTKSGITDDPFIQIQSNALNKLKKENELKSYEDMGVFVTVMNNTFPLDEKHQPKNTLDAVNSGKITKERVEEGRIAVLTNKNGEPLYFDNDGNRTTSDKGTVVYQPLRGTIKDGKLDMSKQNIPTQEELKASGDLERFNIEIQRLTEVRLSKEPVTLKIAEITKGVDNFNKSERTKIDSNKYDILIKSNGYVVAKDKTNNIEAPIYRSTLEAAGLSDFIAAFMNMNNKEGLAANLKNDWQARRDFLEKVIYTSPARRIRFNEPNLFLTSSEEVSKLPVNVSQIYLNEKFDWYKWDGNKFIPDNFNTYQDFLADKLTVASVSPSYNSYIKLGEQISKETKPIQESPKPEQAPLIQSPVAKEFKKSNRSQGIKINTDAKGLSGVSKKTDLKRTKLLGKRITEEQNKIAKEWFDQYLKQSGANFEDLRDVVNSDAWATWSTAAIKLWQGGDFTDLYHEAFHDFSQLFLTKEQKKSLYDEVRKTKPRISDFEAEEIIAEDFRKYMLSGQKLILNNRVKRNTIFRKMYNFLRELFTGTPSLEVVYQKLANQNISSYKRNVDNALFGKLNKNIEGLTFTESVNLYRALDSLIAKQFREFGIPISRLFKEKEVIEKTYQQVALDLKAALDQNEQDYNVLVDRYAEADELTKLSLLPDLTALEKLVNNLSFVLENFNDVRAKHLVESEFLKISKSFVPEEIIDELNPETKDAIYDDKEQESAKDRASNQIIYLLASLPKYINKNGEKVLAYNPFIDVIEDITEFDLAWNRLAKKLTGVRDYKVMIEKIQELTKTNPEYEELLKSLPNPNMDGKELTLLEIQLRNQFINTFSQPYVPLKFASWWKDEKGQLRINTKEATGKSFDLLKLDWDENIQSIPNEYRILDETTGQYSIDIDKITKDFENINKLRPKRKEEFLKALGFSFSPQTLESPEYLDLITDNLVLGKIYNAIKDLSNLKNGILPNGYELTDFEKEFVNKPVTSIIDAIKVSKHGKDKNSIQRLGDSPILIQGQKDNIEQIQAIEINYSDRYFSDNLLNSENSNVWAIRPWSQQSVLYSYLNDPKFETYEDLINDPTGAYFDISKNPDADNIYLNSVFDVVTGKRRLDRKGNPVKINLYNHNGLEINFGNETKGGKTTSLSRFEKLVQDIAPLLLSGNKEHIRYGDKTTSNGTEIRFKRLVEPKAENPYLPVDISSFKNTYLPQEAKAIFRRILHSALYQTNQYFTEGIGKDFSNFNQNLEKEEYWGYFDGILSEETKKALISQGLIEKPLDIFKLIDDNSKLIYRDLEVFLENDVKKIKKEVESNYAVSTEDFIPNELLKKTIYGETEQQSLETIYRAFAINSYIMNLEHTRLLFQDPRFYDNKKGSYREPFKRYAKASSTGTIAVNDDQQNEFLQGSRLEKQLYDSKNPDNKSPEWTETGIENSVIFNDVVISADDFVNQIEDIFKDKPLEEQLAVRKAYSDITSTDAFGFCTFDWYRQWEIRSGNDNWNNEKEELYKKIVTKQPISEDELLKSFAFFPPKKLRVVGFTFNRKTNRFVPIDYKFAVSPLLPNLVEGKTYEVVKDNMLRQNISLGLFKSASKHSAITSDGKFNDLYNKDGSVNTGDYTINPIYSEFIFEVVASPKDYKGSVSFSTQLRKLLFVNSFNNGVPIDFKGDNWESLSQSEKIKQSNIYRLEQEFGDTIDKLVQNEKEKLLKSLNIKIDSEGNYDVSEEKLSELLEKEFKKRNLPNNVIKSIQTVNGKFKYALDASLQRETIEQIILSIVDNRLRKQKGLGESLIQASSIGYENKTLDRVSSWKSINGNDLPFYQYVKDGKTKAQKVKIALQGDFKNLLNLPQVKTLSERNDIKPIEALNTLLKDEGFVDSIRDLITITGVRIPVQGTNSMEFMEVYEFLPEEAGSVIIVSPALVAKSGGDFDWDKITSLYPSFNVTESGILIYPNQSEKVNESVYRNLVKEFDKEISNVPDFYNKLIKSIFDISPEDLQDELVSEDIFQTKTVPSFKTYNRVQTKKALNNRLNQIIRETLERPDMFESLVTPNSTYLFEDIADKRLEAISKNKPTYSDIPSVTESLNQFESNTVGKQSLGIGAIWNTLFSQMQKAGVVLNKTYITNIDSAKPLVKQTVNRLPHNKTKSGNMSLSGIYSQTYKGTKYPISEVISQLMNGWVDVAKKDWIFYINGRKEIAPTLLYTATTGVHKDLLVGFFNQPILYEYIKNLQNYKSQIVRLKDENLYNNAKKNAIYDTLSKYLPESILNDLTTAFENGSQGWEFWNYINVELRNLADSNPEAFEPESFMKFAIPVDKKLAIPSTDQEKLNQALYLVQFLELQEQGNIVEKLRRVVNQDTEKPVNIQYSKERQVRRVELKDYRLIPEEYIEKMANESVIKGFTHSKTGIDKFVEKLTKNVFEITNHPVFNRFLYDEFNKPTKNKYKNEEIVEFGNSIPFSIKYNIYEDWVKAVKNQFIEYLYQNYVYKPNTTQKVANYIFEKMKPSTALALELENIKTAYPDLVENNLLLQFLIRDNSREKVGGKPKYVNLKLRKDRIDSSTSNVLTEAFEDLLNSDISEIQQFSRKLAHFAFIQSGLQKSPISFANIIPQEHYGEDVSNIIKAFSELMTENPLQAKREIQKFYDDYFKKYNRKFFIAQQIFDPAIGKDVNDIDFQSEAYRFRNFVNTRAYDLLSKKQNIEIKKQQEFLDSVKKMSTISDTPFTETTAKENPNNFYIYEFNESKSGKLGSSKVREGGNNTAAIILMKQAKVEGGNWTDDTYASNINQIDSSISEAIAKIQQQKPESIVFPTNLTQFSKLQQFAPKTAAYLYKALQDNFGIDIKPADFDNFKEAPAVEPTVTTEVKPINDIIKDLGEDPLTKC